MKTKKQLEELVDRFALRMFDIFKAQQEEIDLLKAQLLEALANINKQEVFPIGFASQTDIDLLDAQSENHVHMVSDPIEGMQTPIYIESPATDSYECVGTIEYAGYEPDWKVMFRDGWELSDAGCGARLFICRSANGAVVGARPEKEWR